MVLWQYGYILTIKKGGSREIHIYIFLLYSAASSMIVYLCRPVGRLDT